MAWVGLMAKLTDLGFSKGIIFETIVSTYNLDGSPNAAPMGVNHARPTNLQPKYFQFLTNQPQPKNKQMCSRQLNKQHRGFL